MKKRRRKKRNRINKVLGASQVDRAGGAKRTRDRTGGGGAEVDQDPVWAKDSASNEGQAIFPLELGWHTGPLLSPQYVDPSCGPQEYLALAYSLVRGYD
jgi:hypothetical protein